MLTSFSKKIEIVANLAIIVAACLLAIVLYKAHFLRTAAEQTSNTQSGSQLNEKDLSSLDIDWKRDQRTLILAMSTTCHYCSESSPFYQRLAKEAKNTHLLAVLPQSVEEGKSYLNGLRVPIDDIKQQNLGLLGVHATPTLILVDNNGVVIRTWIGKLTQNTEAEILSIPE